MMEISPSEIVSILDKNQQHLEEIKKLYDQTNKDVSQMKKDVEEIKLLPQMVEENSQNVIGNRFDNYINGLPSKTFKRFIEAQETSYKDLLQLDRKIEIQLEEQSNKLKEFDDEMTKYKKKLSFSLLPTVVISFILCILTIINSVIVRNAIDTANSTIASANSTIQQLNSTMDAAIPKIAEVSTSSGIPLWAAVLILGVLVYFIILAFRGKL